MLTTNHKQGLDPELLRLTFMDMHIQTFYCTHSEFKIPASNYLSIKISPTVNLFTKIEKLIMDVAVNPVDISEELLGCGCFP